MTIIAEATRKYSWLFWLQNPLQKSAGNGIVTEVIIDREVGHFVPAFIFYSYGETYGISHSYYIRKS